MSGQHCENYDIKWETVHCYPQNVDPCCTWLLESQRGFQILLLFCFVLLYNKSLNDSVPWGTVNFVSLESQCYIEILGKQNSLFPSGPVIKCLISALEHHLFPRVPARTQQSGSSWKCVTQGYWGKEINYRVVKMWKVHIPRGHPAGDVV